MALAIRNLTPNHFTLKHIERFSDPNTQQSKARIFSFGTGTPTTPAPSIDKLNEHTKTFNREDLNITLSPFESVTLNPPPGSPDSVPNQTLRLTLTTSNPEETHRIDTNPSYTQKSSLPCTPLTPSPSTHLTAIFHPPNPTISIPNLTLHTPSPSPQGWMTPLPSTLPLSSLSIPGTHNSPTHYRALPSVRCQTHPISKQLTHGIRFLDIRLQPVHATDASKKDLYLVHGAFPISLTGPKYFDPILRECYAFLDRNPGETVLISLKREGTGGATDEHFGTILEEHYIRPNREKWWVGNRVPLLGEVRGKLVLVRRYEIAPSSSSSLPRISSESSASSAELDTGLNATSWPYNHPSSLLPTTPLHIQDYCEVLAPSSIAQKLSHSIAHLSLASSSISPIPGINTDATNPVPPAPFFLNFLSGSNFWSVACWPEKIAKIVNRGVEEWICRAHHLEEGEEGLVRGKKEGDGGTGVVVMDCVGEGGDWDLVDLVIGMNMGVLGRMERDAEGGRNINGS
ncbi:PLC-like phosphodiesterase [Dendryphion nanum]|uniref:PLC-like phosphodiesterase n=1 Tax=Dendryphion nanum TaxID=256645 RepID=A0A9P9IPX8_9PLEO|nr:PLC-like phosphodiesterase [Dendryphion nanum]